VKRILDKRKMTEADWQEYRAKQKGVGGSEVSSILEINKYKSKFVLWTEKTGAVEPEPVDNEFVEWGNILEPSIRKKFAEATGFKTTKCNFVLQHDTYTFMIANIDGEFKDPSRKGKGVLEIKTTSEWNKGEWEGDHVPVAYMAQMQHYLAVTGYEYGAFACLVGGNKYRQFFVDRDEEAIELIINAEKEFMEAVEANNYPWSIGGSASEASWLAKQYPNAIEEEMSIPPSIEQLALEYTEIQDGMKELKARAEEIKNQIKFEAKEFGVLRGNQVKIYMPTINKTLFDGKQFAQDHADLYNEYKTKVSSYRDFKVKLLEA
jgi:putative phage-type endonuclease